MARVLVEHVLDPPISVEEHARLWRKVDACLEIRESMRVRSYLSAARALTEVEAPDAEAVRRALRSSGAPHGRAFAVDLVEPGSPPAGAVRAVVEGASVVAGCVRTYVAGDGRRICEAAGDDAAALLETLAGAGEHAWIAQVVRIEDDAAWLARRERMRALLARG